MESNQETYIYLYLYTNSTKCIHEKNQEHYYRWIAVGGPTTDGHPSSWFAERDRARQSETDPRQTRDRARQPPRGFFPRFTVFCALPIFCHFSALVVSDGSTSANIGLKMGQHRPQDGPTWPQDGPT